MQALARGEEVPEDGYQGDYVAELATRIDERGRASTPQSVGRAAVALMIEQIQRRSRRSASATSTTGRTRAGCTRASRASSMHALGAPRASSGTPTPPTARCGCARTSFGDDKDRVLVRSNGEHTYFASDIAYHEDKRERGFDRLIDVWGADHHGYVLRLKAAFAALGGDPDELELLIMQLVHLVRSGERAQMSKRAGEFVTLDELVAEIGVDAARWYLLARSHDTTVDLDLDLARSQSNENPVYYVQYAHARIASMLAKAGAERVEVAVASVAAGVRPTVDRPGRLRRCTPASAR